MMLLVVSRLDGSIKRHDYEITKRWTKRIPNWNRILAQISIHFEERVSKYL